MIDFDTLDALVSVGAYFSINDMTVTVGIENRLYHDDGNDFHGFNVFMKVVYFPLGDNLFNFLAISIDNLRMVQGLVMRDKYWDGNYPTGADKEFLSSLDCIYLYLTYYSCNRSYLGSEDGSKLINILKEFEFVLNFCCNDSFDESLKPLTALQRYYIYCQLYVDNKFTTDRSYTGEDYLFIEPERTVNALNQMPRISKEESDLDEAGEYEPVTEAPNLKEAADTLKNIPVFAACYYKHDQISQYLLKELFAIIKLDARVKKCQNCGKYFILKGDYATEYCDRIPEGEKFTCKKIAAMKARKQKVQGNPILKEYERAYKRMYARLSSHKISNEEFRLWADKAAQKRDSMVTEYSDSPSDKVLNDFKEFLGNK